MVDVATGCSLSMEGGFHREQEIDQPCSSSAGGAHGPPGVLDLHPRNPFFTGVADSRSFPPIIPTCEVGKFDGESFLNSNLVNWICPQPQFYQITSESMGGQRRTTGEIESGASSLSSTNNAWMEGQRLPTQQSWPSSSSSSFRSLSGGCPDMHMASAAYSFSPDDVGIKHGAVVPNQAVSIQLPHGSAAAPASYCTGFTTTAGARPPTGETDDEVVMRAMIAVLSSSAKATPLTTTADESPAAEKRRHGGRAFKPYVSAGWSDRRRALGPTLNRCRPNNMIKELHSILRNIKDLRAAAQSTPVPESARPTSNQLHHVMSERKRREKLNECFQSLMSVLPPGTRKDKASVLAAAKDNLIHLKAQISDLDSKNQALEEELAPTDEADDDRDYDGSPTERPVVRVIKTRSVTEPTFGEQRQLIVGIVSVRAECYDVGDVALCVLKLLKEMEDFVTIESIAAKYIASTSSSSRRRANLTLQIKVAEAEWDEDTFVGEIARAVGAAERTG